MNAYDFDKTIYPGDSATHFWWFCVRRHPAAVKTLFPAALAVVRGRSRGEIKAALYSFLPMLEDLGHEVSLFWDGRIGRIYPRYLARRRDDDLIISASPDFLIGEACRRLGVRHIATRMDPRSGVILGENCRGEEKVRRFREEYGDAAVEEFYSDSLSDKPMMDLSGAGYLVKNGAVVRRVERG